MIDTVIITTREFFIKELSRFGVSKDELMLSRDGFRKYFNNSSKKIDGYQPKITFIKRGPNYNIKIEFSVANILFDNNVEERNDIDWETIAGKLSTTMAKMGVDITKEAIGNSNIQALHASKNIDLKGGYTAIAVLKELAKTNLTQKLDMDHKTFRNTGHALQYYSKAHSLVFYDKIKDTQKPKKRAIDKDQTLMQASLFDAPSKFDPKLQILRIEVRLSEKRKMNSVLKKLGFGINPKFSDILKKDICQKIVKSYWQEMVLDKNLFIFEAVTMPNRVLKDLIRKYPKIKPKEVIYLTALNLLSKDEGGIRNLRIMLEPISDKRTWYRVSNDLKKLNYKKSNIRYHGWVGQITDQIDEFKDYKLPTGN